MGRIEKTVFISYRRTNAAWALAIFQHLTHHGFDVFLDFRGTASGDFERKILENVKARAHFLVLLTPSALERCGDPLDFLRREIETALRAKRNVVPLMLEGFDFGAPQITNRLTGQLAALRHYNGLLIPAEYFDDAMKRLREQYLNVALDAVTHPASASAGKAAREEQAAAASAPAVGVADLMDQVWLEHERIASDAEAANLPASEAHGIAPQKSDAVTRIYHITHVKNLPRILKEGGLQCDRAAQALKSVRIDNGASLRRMDRQVPLPPGGTLGDYAPFYFAPRSPMLYAISRGRAEGDPEGQQPLIHLVSSVEATARSNPAIEWLFTEGHPQMEYTDFFNRLDDLNKVDWGTMQGRYWNATPEDPDRSRRRQAEFLVHRFFPWPLVSEIGVCNTATAQKVQGILNGNKPPVAIQQGWYY